MFAGFLTLKEQKMEKVNEKLFTKVGKTNIMKKNYNPLDKDCKIFESEGLFMRKIEDVEVKGLIEELNFIERIFFKKKFIKIYKKGITYGFNNK